MRQIDFGEEHFGDKVGVVHINGQFSSYAEEGSARVGNY
jgi:hypothetical protein